MSHLSFKVSPRPQTPKPVHVPLWVGCLACAVVLASVAISTTAIILLVRAL